MIRNWNLVAVSAAAAASPGSRKILERPSPGTRATAQLGRLSRTISSVHGEAHSRHADMRGRFDDERSRKQITAYLAYRSRASDERNGQALARWNDNLRQQWELEHLNAGRQQTDMGSIALPHAHAPLHPSAASTSDLP